MRLENSYIKDQNIFQNKSRSSSRRLSRAEEREIREAFSVLNNAEIEMVVGIFDDWSAEQKSRFWQFWDDQSARERATFLASLSGRQRNGIKSLLEDSLITRISVGGRGNISVGRGDGRNNRDDRDRNDKEDRNGRDDRDSRRRENWIG